VAGTTFIVAHLRPDGRRRDGGDEAPRDGPAHRSGGGARATTARLGDGRPAYLRQTTERAPVAAADGDANAAE